MISAYALKLTALFCATGAFTGFGGSFLVAPLYTSTATASYEDGSGQPPGGRLTTLTARVLSRDSLNAIIRQQNLYVDQLTSERAENVVESMRQDLRVRPYGPENREFDISFTYTDPLVAQETVQAVLGRFAEERSRMDQEAGRLRVIDAASRPEDEVSPRRSLYAGVGLAVGLALALTLFSLKSLFAVP